MILTCSGLNIKLFAFHKLGNYILKKIYIYIYIEKGNENMKVVNVFIGGFKGICF